MTNAPAPSLKSLNVLVIDDDDIARVAMREVLEAKGHRVTDLVSAVSAMELIKDGGFDAVILDVILPEVTGDKFARKLRRSELGKELTVVLVSSAPHIDVHALAHLSDADSALAKRDLRRDLNGTLLRAWLRRSRPLSISPFASLAEPGSLKAPSMSPRALRSA